MVRLACFPVYEAGGLDEEASAKGFALYIKEEFTWDFSEPLASVQGSAQDHEKPVPGASPGLPPQ